MICNVAVASAELSALIAAAESGEDVVIARGGDPVVQLVPIRPRRGFRMGVLDGKLTNIPDFFEPMSDDELDLWD